MKSNGQKYRRPLNAILGARALPHGHLICTGGGGRLHVTTAVKQQVRLPCRHHHHHHHPHGLHQGNQNMSNQHTGMCIAPCLPRTVHFNPSASVRLAHANHSEGTEEGATTAFSFTHQQPGFKIEAQIFLEMKTTISAASQSLSKEVWSFFLIQYDKKKGLHA